jgi:hypothetical protein
MRISRRTLAEIAGVDPDTITDHLKLLAEHGCIEQSTTRLKPGDVDPDTGEIVDHYVSIKRIIPLRSRAENVGYVLSVPKPDTANGEPGWGGVKPRCEQCGSDRLHVVCLDCGHHQALPAPSPKKPIHIVKRQDDVSESDEPTPISPVPVVPVGTPSTAPHLPKGGKMPFHDVDRLFDRRKALRDTRPIHTAPPMSPPTLDQLILDAVEEATRRKQPLTDGALAMAIGRHPDDVRHAANALARRGQLKRWSDGLYTLPTPTVGMTGD